MTQVDYPLLHAEFGDDAIVHFGGAYNFLSSFARTPVVLDGMAYPTAEHAFQAQKTTDAAMRARIIAARTPRAAQDLARAMPEALVTPGWFDGDFRDEAMKKVIDAKFAPGSALGKKLLRTGTRKLVQGNTWGDQYQHWGKTPQGKGDNMLGVLLERRRAELAATEAAAPKTPAAARAAGKRASGASKAAPAEREPGAKRQKKEHEPEDAAAAAAE